MGVDTFICGECQTKFHDIKTFIQHKSSNCHGEDEKPAAPTEDAETQIVKMVQGESPETTTAEQTELAEEPQTVLEMVDETGQHQTVSFTYLQVENEHEIKTCRNWLKTSIQLC